jgi:hypothetical protein
MTIGFNDKIVKPFGVGIAGQQNNPVAMGNKPVNPLLHTIPYAIGRVEPNETGPRSSQSVIGYCQMVAGRYPGHKIGTG